MDDLLDAQAPRGLEGHVADVKSLRSREFTREKEPLATAKD